MMNVIKKILPHFLVVLIFLAISAMYFTPIFQGKQIKQADVINFKGMSKEIFDFRENNPGEEPLWTNSMFGGMPAYQISVLYPSNLIAHVAQVISFGMPHPAVYLLLYMLGFYILMLSLKIDPLLGLLGAIAFGFSSYFFVIIDAGHNTKAYAISFMAPVFAGVILTFRGKYLLGCALTALFGALELYANHLQITYYLMMMLAVYGLYEAINIIKNKEFVHLFKVVGVLLIAMILALGSNITNLYGTYDYSKSTTRGKTELTINNDQTTNAANVTSGLDKDYATQWSYGIDETMTFLVPNFVGGSSGRIGQNNKNVLRKVDPQLKQNIGQMDQYWGNQPFTSGPVYVGAGVLFLFVLGLFFVKGYFKWALVVATLISILLSWGRNFMPLTEFFLDYFPGYNKFRTVSMILVIAELTIPILAILGLRNIVKNKELLEEEIKLPLINSIIRRKHTIWIAFALTGGLSLLFFMMPNVFTDFFKTNEYNEIYSQVASSNGPEIATMFVDNIQIAREAIFKADAIRSFFIVLVFFALVFSFIKTRYNTTILYVGLSLVCLLDMWIVNRRYLNNDNFVKKAEAAIPYTATRANEYILQDTDPDYRVLNIAVSTFNDASTSYFHKSIGGYHGAKLKRYQELVDFYISGSIQNIINTLRSTPTDSAIRNTFAEQGILNMLNTRYVIYNPESAPILNTSALGNAWFINTIKFVPDADTEILTLGEINPKETVVVDERFANQVDTELKFDGAGSINLIEYRPNHLTYQSKADSPQFAVFSEVYFENGWNAYVDGVLMPHVRANYVLRAMNISSGDHKIEFKFEPKLYTVGESISFASSSILILLILGLIVIEIKRTLSEQ